MFLPYWRKNCFFGVIEIVLFFSSVISVMGLEKLSIFGLDGRGATDGSLFLNGETFPSDDKKSSFSRWYRWHYRW